MIARTPSIFRVDSRLAIRVQVRTKTGAGLMQDIHHKVLAGCVGLLLVPHAQAGTETVYERSYTYDELGRVIAEHRHRADAVPTAPKLVPFETLVCGWSASPMTSQDDVGIFIARNAARQLVGSSGPRPASQTRQGGLDELR